MQITTKWLEHLGLWELSSADHKGVFVLAPSIELGVPELEKAIANPDWRNPWKEAIEMQNLEDIGIKIG